MPTEKKFGLSFSAIFLVLSIISRKQVSLSITFILLASVLTIISYTAPTYLKKLNVMWFQFGNLLGRFINPISMTIIFYFVFTPYALMFRLFGKRTLDLKYDKQAKTYWKDAAKDAWIGEKMRNQF